MPIARKLGVSLIAVLLAQSDHPQAGRQFRTTAESVEVPVVVLHKRRPVIGLTASDFAVVEDGQPMAITDVMVDAQPLDVTLLLDVSESTASRHVRAHQGLVAAADAITRFLRPKDAVAWYRFAESLERVGQEQLSKTVPRGQTALFDALLEVLLEKPRSSRRIIVVLTDGLDTASSVPRAITGTVADRSDAIVHVVKLSLLAGHWYFGPFGSGMGVISEYFAELKALSNGTGGRFFEVDSPDDFIPALSELLD